MKKHLVVGMAAAVCVMGAGVRAGEEHGAEKPQLYCIYKEIVKPPLTEQYETAIKYMISEFKAYQIDPEKVHFKTISGPEIGYLYVMPIENFAGMDEMRANWREAVEVIGKEKFEDMVAPAEEAIDHVEVFHAIRRADLSYVPENPRLKPDEVEYIHYGFYYVIPGKEKEFEALAGEFVELYKSNNIDSGWVIFQAITGSDLPALVVAHAAKSSADYYSNRERVREVVGEEAKKLGEKVGALVRKMEFQEGMPRPDLSYPEPTMPGPAKKY